MLQKLFRRKLSILLVLMPMAASFLPASSAALTAPGLPASPASSALPFLLVTEAEAATIKLSKTSAVLPVGMLKKLTVSGTTKAATWKSSNKSVATVTSSGAVVAKKTGTATITAKVSGKTLKCKVTVINKNNAKQVANVTLKAVQKYYSSAHLVEYEKTGNIVTVLIGRPLGDGAPGREIYINVASGKATWEDDWDDFFGKSPKSFYVWGGTVPVSKITLSRSSASVVKGKTLTLGVTVSPANAGNKSVIWKSSNNKIATVSSKGVVKGIKAGTATITATAKDGSGKKSTCKITVTNATKAVPNVTDAMFGMAAPAVAKRLGLGTRTVVGRSHKGVRYSKNKECENSAVLGCDLSEESEKGKWFIEILDNTASLLGIRKGISFESANAILKKAGWKRDYTRRYSKSESYFGVPIVVYGFEPTNVNSKAYKYGIGISVTVNTNTGKVIALYCG